MAYTVEELKKIGEDWVNDWANHRSEQAMKLFAQDVEYVGPIRKFKGYDNVVAFVNGFFKSYPDEVWHFRASYADAESQTLIIEWDDTARMTNPWAVPTGEAIQPTGRQYHYVGCDVIKLNEDGKIYHWEEYFDCMTMMLQLGIAKEFIEAMPAMVQEDTAEKMTSTIEEGDEVELS